MFERVDATERFYVDADAADDEAVREGFAWAAQYARDHGHDQILVVAPGVKNFEYLSRVIGPDAAKSLQKQRRLAVGELTFLAATEKKLPYAFSEGPILAVWTRDATLDKLDTLDAPAICAIAWQPDNITHWKANWGPLDIRSGTRANSAASAVGPVVEQALSELSAGVNLGTGLGHPLDRSSAVETFRALRDARESFSPDAIRAWAVQNGWTPEHARDLSEVASKILEGRRLRTVGSAGSMSSAVDRWREAAERRP